MLRWTLCLFIQALACGGFWIPRICRRGRMDRQSVIFRFSASLFGVAAGRIAAASVNIDHSF
jgi:hypothetical protein